MFRSGDQERFVRDTRNIEWKREAMAQLDRLLKQGSFEFQSMLDLLVDAKMETIL